MHLHGGNQVAERFMARRRNAVLVLLLKLSESTDLRVEAADRAYGAGPRHGEGRSGGGRGHGWSIARAQPGLWQRQALGQVS